MMPHHVLLVSVAYVLVVQSCEWFTETIRCVSASTQKGPLWPRSM